MNLIYENRNEKVGNIVIDNAKIIFRNFAGAPSKYNRAGDRNFCVVIEDPEFAETLNRDGWNIKKRMPRDEGDDPLYYLQVKVAFNAYPPQIKMYTKKKVTDLNEETISGLDYAGIENVDLTIRPYTYEVSGRSGISAYLKYMHVTIEEDHHASKYDKYYTDEDEMSF